MKIVKLDKRHELFHYGYTHAFRFDRYTRSEVVDILKRYYPESNIRPIRKWGIYDYGPFATKWAGRNKPYWVAVKDESIITLVTMSLSFNS